MPHLRPVRVLWSVIFWMWSWPPSSALTTSTPSMSSEPSISASSRTVVDRHRRRRVGEAGHDERVVALGGDGTLGEHALVVSDLGPRRRRRPRPGWCSLRSCAILLTRVLLPVAKVPSSPSPRRGRLRTGRRTARDAGPLGPARQPTEVSKHAPTMTTTPRPRSRVRRPAARSCRRRPSRRDR